MPLSSRQPQDLWFGQALLSSGWARNVRLTLRDGLISRVDVGVERIEFEDDQGVALPGIANVHSHAFQRAMAGLTEARGPTGAPGERDDFWSWRRLMYRFLDRGGPQEIEAITAWAFMEMLEGGFTRVCEFHYLHNDQTGAAYADPAELSARMVAAASRTGIGLTLLPVFYAHSTFGGAEPSSGQRRFITTLDGFSELVTRSRSLVRGLPDGCVGVAPHSLRAVTPTELAVMPSLADGGPIHIHIAEQTREVEDCLQWSGARPVEWLLDAIDVDRRWCLIHATHVTEAEWRAVMGRDAVVGLCPLTEANLGDGVFPATAYAASNGIFGIGTDSNVQIGLSEELRMLEYSQRLSERGRSMLADAERSTGRALFERALDGGARASGMGPCGLAVGNPADILALDTDRVAFEGRKEDAVLDSWIFGADRSALSTVWRRGERVVVNGRHIAREVLERDFRQALRTVLAQ